MKKFKNMLRNIELSHLFANHNLVLFVILIGSSVAVRDVHDTSGESGPLVEVPIGAVIDQNSPLGYMADLCMKMAISDFYEAHPNYRTRLKLHTKNAESVLDANFAVVELLKHEEVHGIIGPQGSTEGTFIAELGQEVQVPVISFTARSSDISYTQNRYFVRTTPDDVVQARALADICRGFGWPEVAILYEDTYYGNQFLSHLNKAFQEVEIGLAYMVAISNSADNRQILKELNKLATKQTRVCLVHMSPSLGYRLFNLAKRAGVMSEGYAWIITDSLSIFIASMDSITRDSMEGVLGVRPYVPTSNGLESFQERWKRNMIMKNATGPIMELNVYGLWVYDMVTALAIAVEKISPANSTLLNVNTTLMGKKNFKVSSFGSRLLNELSRTKFGGGLSGDFELVDGKMKPSTFEIFNVFGSGEKTVGFWTPDRGIVTYLSSASETSYSTSTKKLKRIIWPGESVIHPKGRATPATGNLRVGVPWKSGFKEFANVTVDPTTNHTNATGFAVDIFFAALDLLPFHINYEFHYYNDTKNMNWSYDDMLHKIPDQEYDMVVGDATIWAPRANYVDFSHPYSESGVVLVVKNKKPFDMWIFIKPLRWDLWLAIIVACISIGVVLRILEHQMTTNGLDPIMAHKERRMIYLSPVAALAFPERNMVSNNWSLFVLVCWLFMAFILMQSYTANLSAILTVDQLNFAFSDNYYVGYQEGSFMKDFLIKQLHIDVSRLRSCSSAEEYHDAMSKGSKNGGIDAIFDEVPFMKVLLNKYDSQYRIVGPTYRTGGFGFAFPLGSPFVEHFSKAILDVTQGPNMTAIERKNFGPGYSSQDPLSSRISQQTSSLTLYEFAGLFIIIASVTVCALFCSATSIGRKLTEKTRQFICSCPYYRNPGVNSVEGTDVDGESTHGETVENSDNVGDPPQETGLDNETSSADQNLGMTMQSNGERNS